MRVADRLLDTSPLRSSPAFRRLWVTSAVSLTGGQLTTIAVLFHVWQLTGSSVMVGLAGLVQAVPTVVIGLLGGVLADAVERRRLVLVATAGEFVAAAALAFVSVAGYDHIVVVLALVAALSAAGATGAPARRTFVARLLPAHQVAAGVALTHLGFQAAVLVGPAIGGLLIGWSGVVACYLADAVTYLISGYGVARLPRLAPTSTAGPRVAAVWEGIRFIRRAPVVRGAFATDLFATVLAMPVALFPRINEQRFGGSPETLGLFLTAVAAGGIVAGVGSGSVTRARRPGVVMLVAAATWGIALAGFGFATVLWATLGCLAAAGAADTFSVISRGAIVQLATPDDRRGRVTAVEQMVGAAGPDLGNLRAGAVADLTGAAVATIVGGLASAGGIAWIAVRNRPLRRFLVAESSSSLDPD